MGTSDVHCYLAFKTCGMEPAVAFPQLQPPLELLRPVHTALLSAAHRKT